MQRVFGKIEKGEIGVKLDTGDLQGMKQELDRQNDLRILGVVLTAVILGTFALLHVEGRTAFFGLPLSSLGIGLSALIFVWLLVRLRQRPKR
jgi:hypothetical protein